MPGPPGHAVQAWDAGYYLNIQTNILFLLPNPLNIGQDKMYQDIPNTSAIMPLFSFYLPLLSPLIKVSLCIIVFHIHHIN